MGLLIFAHLHQYAVSIAGLLTVVRSFYSEPRTAQIGVAPTVLFVCWVNEVLNAFIMCSLFCILLVLCTLFCILLVL